MMGIRKSENILIPPEETMFLREETIRTSEERMFTQNETTHASEEILSTQNEKIQTPEDTILTLEDISINFGEFKAIQHVSSNIGKNEIRFFIGPNGAGKTTVLDAICGKNKLAEGKIIYQNQHDVSRMKEYDIAQLGIGRKFQSPSVFNGITIWENMELAAVKSRSLYTSIFKKISKERAERIKYVLDFIGLYEKRFKYPGRLSHGEKQWLELGMILVSDPVLMLLDEPLAGMGRKETEKTGELLQKIKQECSIIIVEHDMQFAKDVSDSVTVFHEGMVLDEGTMEQVQSNQKVIDVYLGRGGEQDAKTC